MKRSRRGIEIPGGVLVATLLRTMGMACVVLGVGTPYAATIAVTNNNDSGPGSLRDAVATASSGDTIAFGSIASPITLTTGQITISQDLTIKGPGAGTLTVSAGKASRVFAVTAGVVTISGLTISDGFDLAAGGGIFNDGTLTLTDATVSGNSANICCGGGIYNNTGGTLTLTNVTVTGNHTAGSGGGIGNSSGATMSISNSTVSGGSAGAVGGGIVNGGTMTITYSAVTGNTSNGRGGGIDNETGTLVLSSSTVSGNASGGGGGGIATLAALTVTDSTISGNTAGIGAGISVGGGTTMLTNDTIAANGGGGEAQLDIGNTNGAAATAESTIVANALDGGNNCSGTAPTSNGFNLDSANTCTFGMPTDLTNTDPLLGPLQSNGGPTDTMALLAGSPAINKGANPLALAYDQRGPGFARVVGLAADIGAFEVQAAPRGLAPVPTLNGLALLALAALSALVGMGALRRRHPRRS